MNLGAVLLYADDFEAMLAFYRDVLGLEVVEINAGPEYDEGVDFAVSSTRAGPGSRYSTGRSIPPSSRCRWADRSGPPSRWRISTPPATAWWPAGSRYDFVNRQWGRYVDDPGHLPGP